MYANHCFVDTSRWFALLVPSDPNHQVVTNAIASTRSDLLTTDYVLDELLTLLRARGETSRSLEAWNLLHTPQLVTLVHLTEDHLEQAWAIFSRFVDKEWSFTDCTSKHLIDRHQIALACSLDTHFRQFGSTTVIPT